ncbi:MAG: archease [Candidatus Omnitrophica bacterium]|nr:archease [Candidatus Omnitrophota bacterium]MBU4487786.1 archease [Candidatus Omnitrophota bacterium]MCG2705574.1 archease [Candidatus Omnitrophota bacterium]
MNNGKRRFEITDHTADIAIKVYGNTLKELFENAALGMFTIIADLEGIKSSAEIEVKLEAPDEEELLIEWLEELLYNFYTKNIIFSEFNIGELTGKNLTAKVKGRFIGENRNRLKAEIKAATRHELKIIKNGERYEAQVIFDV